MADFRGSSRELEAFRSILDSYVDDMRREIATMISMLEDTKSRVNDGAVLGAINNYIGLYSNIDEDLAMLEGSSKSIGEMALRFRKGEEVGNMMKSLDSGRRR